MENEERDQDRKGVTWELKTDKESIRYMWTWMHPYSQHPLPPFEKKKEKPWHLARTGHNRIVTRQMGGLGVINWNWMRMFRYLINKIFIVTWENTKSSVIRCLQWLTLRVLPNKSKIWSNEKRNRRSWWDRWWWIYAGRTYVSGRPHLKTLLKELGNAEIQIQRGKYPDQAWASNEGLREPNGVCPSSLES